MNSEDLRRKMLHGNAETLVLRLLEERSMHGYALRWELAQRSNDTFQLHFGGLYPLLDSMERRRLVKSRIMKGRGNQDRRVYTILPRGRKELAARVVLWHRFSQAMNTVLGIGEPLP
jgi:DNA-binding PadR family transcriptional regulator